MNGNESESPMKRCNGGYRLENVLKSGEEGLNMTGDLLFRMILGVIVVLGVLFVLILTSKTIKWFTRKKS